MQHLYQLGEIIIACETYIIHHDLVLMHKRAENKKKFPGFWIGPGGHVDAGEDVLSTAIREVEEETGVIVSADDVSLKVLAFHHHIDRQEVWIEYLFRADIPDKQRVISNHEGKSQWIPIAELLKMENVFPPSQYYFDHIFSDKPGIMYNASQWENAQLVKVQSQRVDPSS